MCEYSVKNRDLTGRQPCKPRYIVVWSNRFVIIKLFVNMYKTGAVLLCILDVRSEMTDPVSGGPGSQAAALDRLVRQGSFGIF